MTIADLPRFSRITLVLTALIFGAGIASAAESRLWAPIRQVFGQRGEVEDGYFRINLPRTDLQVRIGSDALSPHFEFTSYVGFIPMGSNRVMAMGEVVLRADEVSSVLTAAHRQDIRICAVHNHLLGESPRIVYVHIMAEGAPEELARRIRAVYARSGTPLREAAESRSSGNWSASDGILGPHSEADGPVAEYEFPRKERLSVHGMSVKSSGVIESGSEAVFQQLPGGRVASTGELFLLPGEVDPVVRALDDHGLHVTAVHNHMVDDMPRMYWVHWYATGNGPTLAKGVAAALSHMNSARRSSAAQHDSK